MAKLKIAPNDSFSIQGGKLPTLIGTGYTFTFENMNTERGLLWAQEAAVSRGAQLNYTADPFAFAFLRNDGFYLNRYTWLTGYAAYTIDKADTVSMDRRVDLGVDLRRRDLGELHIWGGHAPYPASACRFCFEYISSTGSLASGSPNLLYGSGSNAWSVTLTPTYQYKVFFARAEFSHVAANGTTPGLAFGRDGMTTTQTRVLFETGIVF